jgi:hypothetical protein
MVPKPDGTWQPCGDFRRLNLATKPDKYPLPYFLALSAKLHGYQYFSFITLIKGYHQVPMEEEDIEKTATITFFSLWEYLFMPFGLTNDAQTFQHLMDRLLRHLQFVFTYLDCQVLLHNGGSCNACTMKRCITFRCITKQTTLLNVAIT